MAKADCLRCYMHGIVTSHEEDKPCPICSPIAIHVSVDIKREAEMRYMIVFFCFILLAALWVSLMPNAMLSQSLIVIMVGSFCFWLGYKSSGVRLKRDL